MEQKLTHTNDNSSLFHSEHSVIENEIQNWITAVKWIDGEKNIFNNHSQLSFNDKHASVLVNRIRNDHKLMTLVISSTSITDEGIQLIADALKQNKNISNFNFQWNSNMTDKGLKAIADMLAENDVLVRVYLGKPNNTTPEGVEYLAKKVAERERNYPNLNAEVDFTEVSGADDKVDLDKIYEDALKNYRTVATPQVTIAKQL